MYSLPQHLWKYKALLTVVARMADFASFLPGSICSFWSLWVLKLIVLQFRFMSHFELSDEIILNLNLGFDLSEL